MTASMAVVVFPAAASFSPNRLSVPPDNCETANQTDRRFEIFAFGDRSLTQPLICSCSPRLYDNIIPNLPHPADQMGVGGFPVSGKHSIG